LNTFAAAEQLYDALYAWNRQGRITVDCTSLAFFRDVYPSAAVGTYESSTSTYSSLYNAVMAYADSYVAVAAKYTPSSGALAEQYSRSDGTPLSASDLTWSYAAFLTMTARRNGVVPASWGEPNANNVPGVCVATSAIVTYSTATNTIWSSQTSASGFITTTVASASSTAAACPSTVAVTFNELVNTVWGDAIKITGSVSQLSNWDTSSAIVLSASQYTTSIPLWSVTINLPAGTTVQYKFIKVSSSGTVTWESDPNRSYTVPSCVSTATVSTSWS
jgi:glucoamylase